MLKNQVVNSFEEKEALIDQLNKNVAVTYYRADRIGDTAWNVKYYEKHVNSLQASMYMESERSVSAQPAPALFFSFVFGAP